ncbi:hypothetical protein [Flavobacterium sp.]|uniref:hypothetical protein n=1 Tax=Flavobacterium sp. TaxID=239 RepID=UPI003D6BC3A5
MNKKEHKYLSFSDKPRVNANTDAASMIVNFLFGNQQSLNKWRKDKKGYNINWTDQNQKRQISESINYIIISNFIRENGYFDTKNFNLPKIECFWLDFSLDIKINWHTHDETAPTGLAIHDGVGQQQYGEKYPISPKLNREGHSFTTMQPQLLHRIVTLRNKLIENSHLALEDDWFFDLRSLINETVSIVEITLNQIYNKAEYNPLPNWKFDKTKLGEKHGRRFEDKLSWIFKISGNHLGAENYIEAVNNLRELRNHMMHFDPPSLVITIEEASIWLNQVIDVGYLLIRMRKAIGAEVSLQLINFILQKEVMFIPEVHFSKRLPLGNPDFDYASSTWKK